MTTAENCILVPHSERRTLSASGRCAAGAALLGCAALLSVAAWLRPDARGHGTHEQLGQPPCLTIMLWGVPCPTCGMCTAFAHTVRGQLPAAFHAQPAGLALAVATVVAAVVSAAMMLTGRTLPVSPQPASTKRLVLLGVLVFFAGWAYKIIVMAL